MLDHTVPDQEVELTAPEGQSEIQLHIMVENQGRVNYADYGTSVLNNQRRGKNHGHVNYVDYRMSVLNSQRRGKNQGRVNYAYYGTSVVNNQR